MGGNFLKSLFGIGSKASSSDRISVVPSAMQKVETIQPRRPAPSPPPELIAGNFCIFEFLIELTMGDVCHLGVPKVCLRDMSTGKTSWGSKIDWAWPNPEKPRAAWIDDDQRGLSQRILERAEDALGAEGIIGDMRLRFERILDLGQNQIVYALYCPEKDIRLAYGFDRTIFEPAWKK